MLTFGAAYAPRTLVWSGWAGPQLAMAGGRMVKYEICRVNRHHYIGAPSKLQGKNTNERTKVKNKTAIGKIFFLNLPDE